MYRADILVKADRHAQSRWVRSHPILAVGSPHLGGVESKYILSRLSRHVQGFATVHAGVISPGSVWSVMFAVLRMVSTRTRKVEKGGTHLVLAAQSVSWSVVSLRRVVFKESVAGSSKSAAVGHGRHPAATRTSDR